MGRTSRNFIPRNMRICSNCDSSDVEDEYHFICICPKFETLRKQYIKRCYFVKPSMYKFMELISTENKAILINLAKYIKHALSLRNTYVNC